MEFNAQEATPLLTGKVTVSIKEGTFECDLTLSDIPYMKKKLFRLNSGMNLLNVRCKKPEDFLLHYKKSMIDTFSTGESSTYQLTDKLYPKEIQIRYVGKFPVIGETFDDNNLSMSDWKGNIAFNGYSLRIDGFQSAWYPIFYDIDKDKAYAKVRYDIELICKDCSMIYINGSKPVEGTKSVFKSDAPCELAMFIGNYKADSVDGTYFLNPELTKDQIKELSNLTKRCKKYYESKLKLFYSQDITYVNTTPTSKRDAWLFVSYPTIMVIGRGENGLKGFFDEKRKDNFQVFIAHELGHYYFGSYRIFNSTLGDMMTEGFTEYLALRAAKDVISKEIFEKRVKEKIEALDKFQPIPFYKINSQSEYRNRELYVYYYAPIIFLAIEKEIGEKRMWQWLQNILQLKQTFTDYVFLTSTLKEILNNDKLFELIQTKYFQSENSIQNAIDKIN